MTDLVKVPLGETDMSITRVGLGAWAIGGAGWEYAWGAQDDKVSVATIRHAVEAGVNWIDTAAAYGLGHSESIIAQALHGIPDPDRPYIFTKAGLVWDDADASGTIRRVGAPASIRHEVEASLTRLDVERIDLYQMHWPAEDGTQVDEYWKVFSELLEEGKVRAIGLSNHSVKQIEAARTVGPVHSLQTPFNLVHPESGSELIPWCEAQNIAVLAYSPMASGLLTGAFTHERVASLATDDWRKSHPDFNGDAFTHTMAIVDQMRPIASTRGITVGAVAVAWALAQRGVTGAIVGARSTSQIDGWLPAARLELTPVELASINTAKG